MNHQFDPKAFYTTLGAHPPALTISPGDRVVTTTVDASGRDASGDRITPGGNPQTGPFYIEGAEPGDMLVVHLERIMPNRSHGWSSPTLAYTVVDPDFLPELIQHRQGQDWQPVMWEIDPSTETISLRDATTRLGHFALPIQPMLGCFGVSPAGGQHISTATSAENGGNMDYRGFVAGSTAYFPVFVPGALFFLGDGHAVQGDGEIAGTGVEVSMDVTFSVEVIKGKKINWPRGENDAYIFTLGNARPLDQALQHATTEMVRWLVDDFNLDLLSASILMGQQVEYEVGNVFDPAYTMVCKMKKRSLQLTANS